MHHSYYQAYNTIRGVTGIGTGKGPYIVIHEGFAGIEAWKTFLSGADRLVLDQHPYNGMWNSNGKAGKRKCKADPHSAFGPPNTNPWDVQVRSIQIVL